MSAKRSTSERLSHECRGRPNAVQRLTYGVSSHPPLRPQPLPYARTRSRAGASPAAGLLWPRERTSQAAARAKCLETDVPSSDPVGGLILQHLRRAIRVIVWKTGDCGTADIWAFVFM